MKDKLRGLAARWTVYGSHMTGHECSDELLAILDAEGDGRVVGVAASMPGTAGFTIAVFKADDVPVGTEVYTHPARSGVVSDEDVRDAGRYRWLRDLPLGSPHEQIGNFPGVDWDAAIDAEMAMEAK